MKIELIQRIGGGSFGQVHHGRINGQDCALKTFEPSPAVMAAVHAGQIQLDELKRRFEREVKYQSAIDHPNVVRVIGADLAATPPLFAMELAECSLADDLDADRTLGGNPRTALFDILNGLEAIHEQGITHRDLKPQNVLRLRNADGSVRYAISDFGLMSAAATGTTTLTVSGTRGGTPDYAAPELINDFKRATPAADIYSFGAILHDIFGGGAGRVPYTELTVAGPLGPVIQKCTRSLPKRRFQSVPELRAALYDYVQGPIQFESRQEQYIIELLIANDAPSTTEWDAVFVLIDDQQTKGASNHKVFDAFREPHLRQLAAEAPELLASFGKDYCDYVKDGEGRFNFDYCDVIADKLTLLFQLGSIELKARILLELLVLGVSHNRWLVERRFVRLAGKDLDERVAKRLVTDIRVQGFPLNEFIERVEASISVSRESLHPLLQAEIE